MKYTELFSCNNYNNEESAFLNSKKKAVIFDLDGTLVNTFEAVYDAVNYTMRKINKSEKTKSDVKSYIKKGGGPMMHHVLKGSSDSIINIAQQYFVEYYTENLIEKSEYCFDIENLIDKLIKKGFLLGVVTNKNESMAKKITEYFFPGKFDVIIGSFGEKLQKPDPVMLNRAMKLLGVNYDETIYVGDGVTDYYSAINANVTGVLCTWGFTKSEEFEKFSPKHIINTPKELLSILEMYI